MKKRITRRILAGFLAFLMLFSTVTWDELALASVAAETVENTENGDISDGDKEPVQDVSGEGAKIKEGAAGEEDVSGGDEPIEEKAIKAFLFNSKEDMESYIGGQTDDAVLNLDSAVEADTVNEALTALQANDPGDGYVLVRQMTDVDPVNRNYEDITAGSAFKAVVLDGATQIPHWWDETNQVEYTIYRGQRNDEQTDCDRYATKDGETFYAFDWENLVDKTRKFTREELEAKYTLYFEEDTYNPTMHVNSITLETAGTTVYAMEERVSVQGENELRLAVNNADGKYADFYFVGNTYAFKNGALKGDGNVNLHLRIGGLDASAVSGFHKIRFEGNKDLTYSELHLREAGYTDIDGLEAVNINAALILDYSKDGEETKVEDAALIQIKGETAATEGNYINIRYDGLCFGEEDGNHRMEPNVGEKAIDFADGAGKYADKFRYHGRPVDENGCIAEDADESLYRGYVFNSREDMNRYINGDMGDEALDTDSEVYAGSMDAVLAKLQNKAMGVHVLIRQQQNAEVTETVTIPAAFETVVMETTGQVPHWWDEETQTEYIIWRARENGEQQENELYATTDEENFYAFNWKSGIDASKTYTREDLQKKYTACFEPDGYNPDIRLDTINVECAETALYFVGDSVALQPDGSTTIMNNDTGGNAVDVYFVTGNVRTGNFECSEATNLHLQTPEFSTENANLDVRNIYVEKYRDNADVNLSILCKTSPYVKALEVGAGVDLQFNFNYWDTEGNETKLDNEQKLLLIGSLKMADDDRSIRLHYDGLCFEENDGEHRMEPATGEEVIRFSDQSAAYASRFLYDGCREIDENGRVGTNEALYRGVLLDVATYSAVWKEEYNESFDSDCVFYADSLEELFDRMSRGNLEKKLGYAAVWTQNWIPGDTYEDINIPAEFRGVLFLGDGHEDTCYIDETEYRVYTIFYTENHTDEEEVLVRRFAILKEDEEYREITDGENGPEFKDDTVYTKIEFEALKKVLQPREGTGVIVNKVSFHTRQITVNSCTEICFGTGIEMRENAEYNADDELVIKSADGTLHDFQMVVRNLYLAGQITCSDEDQAGLIIRVEDRLQAYSVKAGVLIVATQNEETAHVDYIAPLHIKNWIHIANETYMGILDDYHGVLFYTAELSLDAALNFNYADTGFPVRGETVMVGGLSGSHEERVKNFVIYDRAHDKNYEITADGVAAMGKYSVILFDSEENLDKWTEEWDDSTIVEQYDEENLQDALDLVEDYEKDCYVLVVTWDEVKGADSVEVPENVKKITFNGWDGKDFALREVVMESSDTMLQIDSALVSDDGTFTVIWSDGGDGEIFFAAAQEKLEKVVSCDGDGDDAGILLVPKEAEVVLPFIEHFRAVVFQGGTLILTTEKRTYQFTYIALEAESNLVLPSYNPKHVPEFEKIETQGNALNVSFKDTSAMDYGSRIVKYTDWEYEDAMRQYLRVSLPFGILDYEGTLRKVAIPDDNSLDYRFTYEDTADTVKTASVVLRRDSDADIPLGDKYIGVSDSSTVYRNAVSSVTVAAGGTNDVYLVEIGITKNFGPQELYLWYTSEEESFVIGKLEVFKEVENVKVVKVYDLEPVTYSYGMPEEESKYAWAIFPKKVKVLLSDGRTVEIGHYDVKDGGLTEKPTQTTTYTLTAQLYDSYEFAEGVSDMVSYKVTVQGKPYEIIQKSGLSTGIHTLEEYRNSPEFTFVSDPGEEVCWCYTLDGEEPHSTIDSETKYGTELKLDLSDLLEQEGKATVRMRIIGDDKHPSSQVYTFEYSVCYDNFNITVETIPAQEYTGAQIKPVVKAYDGDKLLTLNKDYTLSYKNNINAAAAGSENAPTVILKGKGAYSDTIEIPFTIKSKSYFTDISGKTFLPLTETDGVWTADLKDAKIVVKDGKKVLKEGTDYTVTYSVYTGSDFKKMDSSVVICTENNTTALIEVNGKGNYEGAVIFHNVDLSCRTDFTKAKITLAQSKVTYMGGGELDNRNPVTVKLNGKVIDAKYYEVSYADNDKPGMATVYVSAKDEVDGEANIYAGVTSATYPIVRAKLSEAVFDNKGKIADKEYAFGEPVTVENGEDYLLTGRRADGTANTMILTEGVDYEVTYQKNISAGTATVIFTALDSGVYTGSVKKTFKIVKPALFVKNASTKKMELNENLEILVVSESDIFRTVLSGSNMGTMGSLTFEELGVTPEVYVTYKGVTLKEGVDYKLTVANNKAVSTYDKNGNPAKYAAITITGMGNFTGTLKGSLKDVPGLTYTVEPRWLMCRDLNNPDATANCGEEVFCSIPSVVYKKGDKTVYKPAPVITSYNTGKKLSTGKDYTVTYLDNTNKNIPVDEKTGLPTETVYQKVKIEFKGNYRGEAVCTYAVTPLDFKKLIVTVDKQTYAPGEEVPHSAIHVKVSKNSKEELKEGVDYTIVWDTGRFKVGTGEICIEGMGAYSGTRIIKYTVEKAKLDWEDENFRITIMGNNIYGEENSTVYMDKKGAAPGIHILYGHRVLKEGVDYTVSYTNNKAVTTDSKPATYKITGKGDFTGTISGTYKIVPKSLHNIGWGSEWDMTIQPLVYRSTAKSYNVKIALKQNGVLLKEGKDYRIVYEKDQSGKYANDASYFTEEAVTKGCKITFTVEGMGDYCGTATCSTVVLPVAISRMNITFGSSLYYGVTDPDEILARAKITYKIGKNTYTLSEQLRDILLVEVQNVSVNGLNGKAVLDTGLGVGSKNFTFKYYPKNVNRQRL